MIQNRLIAQMQAAAVKGQLTVTFPDGSTHCFGRDDGKAKASVRFLTSQAVRNCYFDPELGFGEAYINGELEIVDGDLTDFLRFMLINKAKLVSAWAMFHGARRKVVGALPLIGSIGRAARDVSFHYDSDPVLFRAFLDEDMNYSCAYFRHETDTLEQAQQAKQRKIIRKVDLRDGGRVLDIGCGWGSMAIKLAQAANVEVIGVTLSEKQAEVARQRVADAGLSDRVSIQLQDYRTMEGQFDHICSIGMMEHVGKKRLTEYFSHIDRLLVKTGTALIHAIHRVRPNSYNQAFVERYIFPGTYAPSIGETSRAIERNNILNRDIEVWPIHYASTLREWRRRFHAAEGSLRPHMGDRDFRIWDLYLASMEQSFLVQRLFVAQFLLSKHNDRVSRTREDYNPIDP